MKTKEKRYTTVSFRVRGAKPPHPDVSVLKVGSPNYREMSFSVQSTAPLVIHRWRTHRCRYGVVMYRETFPSIKRAS